ncbi:hypothetical protein MMC27_006220 [Xylographa pallens]|nr:hypothetical protein [Xylographa pallens]
MAEGSTGGTRAGGEAQGDSFTKREKANEDFYIRQQEKEKYIYTTLEAAKLGTDIVSGLMALKAKLGEQQRHLEELSKHIDEMAKESGGEKN